MVSAVIFGSFSPCSFSHPFICCGELGFSNPVISLSVCTLSMRWSSSIVKAPATNSWSISIPLSLILWSSYQVCLSHLCIGYRTLSSSRSTTTSCWQYSINSPHSSPSGGVYSPLFGTQNFRISAIPLLSLVSLSPSAFDAPSKDAGRFIILALVAVQSQRSVGIDMPTVLASRICSNCELWAQ